MRQHVEKHIFLNGLTLIVDEAPELRSVSLAAWVKTGSRHESIESWGMCHFLEHMIFKGGKKRGAIDISKAVDRVGGDFNAFTSREHTCFHFYLPSKELGLGVSLLKEILYRPLFAAKEIEREREVVLQEIAMTKEAPEEESFDKFLEKCFGKHPMGRNILGNEESIRNISREKLFDFFHQHYRPENMVVALSGSVSFEKAKRALKPLGETAWPKRNKSAPPKLGWGVDPPKETVPGIWWVNHAAEQAHVVYGIPASVKTQKERVISTVIQQHLGGGMSSVLFDQIREKKGWAYTVYASAIHFLDAALFTVYAGVKPEKVLDTLRVCRKEIQRIAKEGIPASDLRRIKDSLIYSHELSLENSESRMMSVSSNELFFKREMPFDEFRKLVRSIHVEDTRVIASRWLTEGKPSILILGEKPKNREQWRALKEESLRLTGEPIQIETLE